VKLLVDGDVLRYRCAFAAEKTHYLVSYDDPLLYGNQGTWQNPENHKAAKKLAEEVDGVIWSRKEIQPVEFAIHATNTVLESLVERFSPSSVDVYLSDSSTFRHRLATTKPYKGNRNQPKPVYYEDVGNYLLSRGAITRPDIEADDCMSIEASKDPKNTIIVTIDKDLLQVPGNHYNWVTTEYTKQSKKNADFSLATQLLTGDTTDNIPGLPGIGPANAEKLLTGAKNSKDLFGRVFKAYEEKIGKDWEDYFCEQFGLIYLLRNYEQKDIYEASSPAVAEQIRSTVQGAA